MRGLWWRLLRAGGRSARLEAVLPVVAGAVITVVLLLLLGLQQGLDQRSERTAWRTPDAAAGEATVLQGGFTDYLGERPLAVVELAALTADPPAVPGMAGFPAPGELWASPALAALLADRPADELADRFPGPVTAELTSAVLEYPDELVAVVGRSPDDPAMRQDRPKHQWNAVSSVSRTGIDAWSTTPDAYQTTYRDMALLAAVLAALPLAGLGGLAARLMAGRRQRRLATLRLLGATTSQVVRLTVVELATLAGIGAVCGAVVHRLLLPLAARVPIKGGEWFAADVRPGLLLTAVTMVAVVAGLTLGAVTGLAPAVRDPLGSYRRSQPEAAQTRWWAVVFIGAAVALFWLRSSNEFVSVAFTAVVILGWGLVSTGPWIISGLGRLLARRARTPASLLAGRRLVDRPRGAWRTVGGLALATFIAGFAAAGLPAGLAQYDAEADRLDAVVPAASASADDSAVEGVLAAADVRADVETARPPSWLDDDWVTLAVTADEPEERERARTALLAAGLWGSELRLAEALPTRWLVQDGVAVGLLVVPVAALVALASMVIGTIARIIDQRAALSALRLSGTPQTVLVAAQRREIVLPTLLLGGIAAAAGLTSGATLGSVGLLNPYTAGIVASVFMLGVLALLLADRTTRLALEHTSIDISGFE